MPSQAAILVGLLTHKVFCIDISTHTEPNGVHSITSSMSSNLEAFSYNSTDDSIATLPFQAIASPSIRTTGSSRTKADY